MINVVTSEVLIRYLREWTIFFEKIHSAISFF